MIHRVRRERGKLYGREEIVKESLESAIRLSRCALLSTQEQEIASTI